MKDKLVALREKGSWVQRRGKGTQSIDGWAGPINADQIRKDPGYVDESVIMGYRTLRVHLDEANGSQTDLYRAPELHGMLTTEADGNVMLIEPEKIEVTEPAFAPPGFPVTKDIYNSRHPNPR